MSINVPPHVGMIVKLGTSDCGVIKDVFRSDTSQEVLVRVLFVKNIFKAQKAELQSWDTLSALVNEASAADVSENITWHYRHLQSNLNHLW